MSTVIRRGSITTDSITASRARVLRHRVTNLLFDRVMYPMKHEPAIAPDYKLMNMYVDGVGQLSYGLEVLKHVGALDMGVVSATLRAIPNKLMGDAFGYVRIPLPDLKPDEVNKVEEVVVYQPGINLQSDVYLAREGMMVLKLGSIYPRRFRDVREQLPLPDIEMVITRDNMPYFDTMLTKRFEIIVQPVYFTPQYVYDGIYWAYYDYLGGLVGKTDTEIQRDYGFPFVVNIRPLYRVEVKFKDGSSMVRYHHELVNICFACEENGYGVNYGRHPIFGRDYSQVILEPINYDIGAVYAFARFPTRLTVTRLGSGIIPVSSRMYNVYSGDSIILLDRTLVTRPGETLIIRVHGDHPEYVAYNSMYFVIPLPAVFFPLQQTMEHWFYDRIRGELYRVPATL